MVQQPKHKGKSYGSQKRQTICSYQSRKLPQQHPSGDDHPQRHMQIEFLHIIDDETNHQGIGHRPEKYFISREK